MEMAEIDEYLTEPGAEVGVADGSEQNPDSDLHAFGRVDLHVLHDQGLARGTHDGSCDRMEQI